MNKIIGIIGYGNMGSAIAERIKSKYKVFVFDIDRNKTKGLKNISVSNSIDELIKAVDVIILAIKPQDFDIVLNEIKGTFSGQLIISIAAGIPTAYIERILGKVKVVRSMPNLPAKIGQGMICLSKGKYATGADLDFAERLFSYLGKTMKLDEKKMDAATAVSGSGPGFIYSIIGEKRGKRIKTQKYIQDFLNSEFKIAAKKVGFNARQAKLLADATVKGSFRFWIKSKLPLRKLKKRVASKGGTTEAGLKMLKRRRSLSDAVKAAVKRAKELSRKG